MLRVSHYYDGMEGTPLQDPWTDTAPLTARASVLPGFPTHQPSDLLERAIALRRCPGEGVLDPVRGCGTTIVAGRDRSRNWVGIVIFPPACRRSANGSVSLSDGLWTLRDMGPT